MKTVLIINASTRKEQSHSRQLTQLFEETWRNRYPEDRFIYREAGLQHIPHIDECWIQAAFMRVPERTTANQRPLLLSNKLVAELKTADIIVIGTPMYNWGIPSGLKAYIDQVMRINETWKFQSGAPDGCYIGLLKNKRLFILSSRGDNGYDPGQPHAHMNYQTAYLQMIFTIMGVTDVQVFSLNNEEYGGERFAGSKKEIFARLQAVQ